MIDQNRLTINRQLGSKLPAYNNPAIGNVSIVVIEERGRILGYAVNQYDPVEMLSVVLELSANSIKKYAV